MLSARNLGLLVGRARKALVREFEARVAAYDLTLPQVHVLRSLWDEDGRTISQLSTDVCSDGPTLTSLLDRMEAKDLISRKRDPDDRRAIRIYLNPHGRAIEGEVRAAGEEVIELVRRGMTEDQIDQLSSLLLLMCETMENLNGGHHGSGYVKREPGK